MAMEVSKIFSPQIHINSYTSLGIGRLIYQLPIPLCNMYLKEILGDFSIDDFDDETLVTINKFFENSLNVSETSRQLYIHRNTLVYRLDKIQKITGLDLRIFDDAVTFKIALMVSKYMNYVENMDRTDLQIDFAVGGDLQMFADPAVDLFRIADFHFAELRLSGQHQSDGIQRTGGEFAEGSLSARGIKP